MINQDILKKLGDNPRLIVIEAYLTKHNNKDGGHADEIGYLKEKKVQSFLSQFHTHEEDGLSSHQVERNREKYGKNEYKKKATKTFWQILFEALSDQMLIILMVAAVISIVVEFFFAEEKETFWLQGVSILAAVVVVSLVASVNDYQKQKQFQELNKIEEATNMYKVFRNGKECQVHKNDIVVGDILQVEGGNQIPADGIIIKAQQVIVDQGAITGEAVEKYKNTIQNCDSNNKQDDAPSPVMISGTNLNSGTAKMLVLVVGKESTSGKLNEQIFDEENDQKTPLQLKLDVLVDKIGKLGVYSALAVFIALTIRLFISDIIPDGWEGKYIGEILKYLILAVSIVVVAIPEGLPLAVTLSLAYSVKQMLKQQNLVRKLASCETMGGAHVICTDKTGTLTKNQMYVVEVWDGQMSDHETYKKNFDSKNYSVLNSLMMNTKAQLDPTPKGSSTQIALLRLCKALSPRFYQSTKEKMQEKILRRIPFNSDRKRMSTIIKEESGKVIILQKGGVDIVLDACQNVEIDGNLEKINKKTINQAVEKMAKKGLRVLALAYKQLKSSDQKQMLQSSKSPLKRSKDKSGVLDVQKSGFILQLIVGIQDLPRQETKKAIQNCHRGRVLVIMVTGDNQITARAIADQVGITNPNDDSQGLVRNGKQIQQLSPDDDPEQLERALKNLKVLARSRPEHKYKLVQCIKKLNNVVAVTGDGTNDAPALMKADVGFSMGVKGTHIAKSASDIIIRDDKFDSIVRALIWGRNIYESIRKFLQFQLTVNIVACLMSVISSVIIRQSVLTAIQMLWVNLIMDSLASLALATQPPQGQELLDRRPFEKKEPLITKTMIKHILGQSIFQIVVLLILLFFGPMFIPQYADQYDEMIGQDLQAKYYMGEPQGTVTSGMMYTMSGKDNYAQYYEKYHVHSRHFTFIFTTFVLMQFFNFFNCRRIRDEHWIMANPCSNWLYWLIVGFIFLFQWIIVTYLNIFFKLYNFGGLTVQQWLFAFLIGSSTLLISQLLRILPLAKPEDLQGNSVYDEQLMIRHRKYLQKQQSEENSQKNQAKEIET